MTPLFLRGIAQVLDDKDQLAAANVATKLGQVMLRRRARKAKERKERMRRESMAGAVIAQDDDDECAGDPRASPKSGGSGEAPPVGMGELDAVQRQSGDGGGSRRQKQRRNERLLLSAIRALLSGRAPVLPTPRCVLIEGFPLPRPPRCRRGVDDFDIDMAHDLRDHGHMERKPKLPLPAKVTVVRGDMTRTDGECSVAAAALVLCLRICCYHCARMP